MCWLSNKYNTGETARNWGGGLIWGNTPARPTFLSPLYYKIKSFKYFSSYLLYTFQCFKIPKIFSQIRIWMPSLPKWSFVYKEKPQYNIFFLIFYLIVSKVSRQSPLLRLFSEDFTFSGRTNKNHEIFPCNSK